MGLTMLKVGDMWAVFHEGDDMGVIRKEQVNGKRMWRADGPDGRRGIFPDKRTAATWLIDNRAR